MVGEDQKINDIESLQEPPVSEEQTNQSILHGPLQEPILILQGYEPDKWERFIVEWAIGCLGSKYSAVWKSKGSGDKGRDVIGFYSEPISISEWDNFQCKHYKDSLTPTDIWVEVGKVIYFSYRGDFRPPKSYKFVAPKGIGAKLLGLLEKPTELKSGLIENWNKYCRDELISGQKIEIDEALDKHISNFDFSIFSFIEPQQLIEDHSKTKWHPSRFGGGLRKMRPKSDIPPDKLTSNEQVYTSELIAAYSDHSKAELTIAEITDQGEYGEHFKRQRENFYEAESLRRFAEETLGEGARYNDLEKEIFDGVIDVVESQHQNAFEKVKDTLKTAKNAQISDHPLKGQLRTGDRGGICHQLVNKRKFKWKKS